jgi:vitamin B12 transporter
MAGACGSLAAAPAVVAETSGPSLDQVLVTGRLEAELPLDLQQYGTRVETVTAAQIRDGGYVDVAESLQALVPGLYVASRSGPFSYADVSLLGSRTEDVLWLVDGVRISNRLYGGTTPLDTLPASIVERIEVIEGPQALFYGTQGVAGAINVITKSFSRTPDGAITGGGDTNGSRHFDGFFRDTLAGQQFVVYASSDHAAGYRPFRAEDYQASATDRDRSYDLRTVGAKYGVDLTSARRFSASFQHAEGTLDLLKPMLVSTAYNDRDEDIASAKLDYSPSEQVQLFLKGYLHRWRSHWTEYDNDPASPGTVVAIDDHDPWGYKDSGANAAAKIAIHPGLTAYLGADYQSYSGSDAVLVIARRSEDVHALFGELATTSDLFSRARFAAGFRWNSPSFGPAATVWDASGRFELPGGLYVRALAGTAFRLPTAEELFADDPQDERGDPNLHPERSRNLNVSLGGSAGGTRLGWELVGFLRDIDDLISLDGYDPVTNQSLFENVPGTVRVRGAELLLDARLAAPLSLRASYTYSRSREEGNLQIARVPEQQAKVVLDYRPADARLGVTLALDYVGNVYQTVWDGRERFGNYVVADLAARVFLDAERHHLITARLENAFDRRYAASLGTGQRDVDGSDYTYWNLGVPRTLEVRYSYRF